MDPYRHKARIRIHCVRDAEWGGKASVQHVLNQIRDRVLNPCRIWSPTQLNTPLYEQNNVCINFDFGKRGGGD